MNKKTLILIPHYNNLSGLKLSISSIKEDDSLLLDLLVVDDGSNKEKPRLSDLKDWYKLGEVFLFDNQQNRGIEYALNDGLKFAPEHGYDYVARLDCGDICYPNRFSKQLRYLSEHPDVGLLGAWCKRIDIVSGRISDFCPPVEHKEIVKQLKMHNTFCHPLVIFNTKVIDLVGYYPMNYKYAEDFAYFSKVAKVAKVANLPEFLLDYEINPTGISLSRRKIQLRSTIRVIRDNFDFSLFSCFGLLWYGVLLIIPYNFATNLKRLFKK